MTPQYAKQITAFYADGRSIDFVVPIKVPVRQHLRVQGCLNQAYHYEITRGYWNGSCFEAIDWLNDPALIAASRKETKRLDAIRAAARPAIRAFYRTPSKLVR